MSGGKLWTAEEDLILRTTYSRRDGVLRCARLLPHRSLDSLHKRASLHGLRAHRSTKPWTQREDQILRLEWGEVAPRTLREKLRPHTWTAIVWRAKHLKLGSPARGLVSVKRASVVCGYCVKEMRRILAAHGVTIHQHPGGMLAQRRRERRELVDIDDALAAVERHMAAIAADVRETIREAAQRHGVSHTTMAFRLDRAGLLPRPGSGHVVRVLPADADRAIAEWKRLPRGTRPKALRVAGVVRASHVSPVRAQEVVA